MAIRTTVATLQAVSQSVLVFTTWLIQWNAAFVKYSQTCQIQVKYKLIVHY